MNQGFERHLPMNLKGSLAKLQLTGAQVYQKRAQLFEANHVIRETWVGMERDMEQQAAGLERLHSAFWKNLREEVVKALLEAIKNSSTHGADPEGEDRSLQVSFARTLDFEESLILSIYVPIIRCLRADSSDQGLEFYIMVKAHVARLSRLIQPFAGDPSLIGRIARLNELFEHAVQSPEIPSNAPKSKSRESAAGARSGDRTNKASRSRAARASQAARHSPALGGHVKHLPKRTKAIVGNLELPRRRARG